MTNSYMAYVEKGLNAYVNYAMKGQRGYINEFFSLKCASDLLALRVFPDAKEVTESMSAYRAVTKYFKYLNPNDPNIVAHVVADGSTPRTGAYSAFLSKWHVYSIDPQMKDEWTIYDTKVNRLHCYKNKIEDIASDLPKPNIIVLVHPHVTYQTIKECYNYTNDNIPIVAIPCCIPYPEATITYYDAGIWSPKSQVYIYK